MTTNVAPDWIQLLPSGTFSGIDGRGPYKVDNPAIVIAASMQQGRLPVDENHSTDLAAPKGGPSPAVGWIVEMQSRPAGIYGRVEWTPTGLKLLAEKAYRGISPVFSFDDKDGKTKVVSSILRAALTNTPNLIQLATLNAVQAVWHSSLAQAGQYQTLATHQPTTEERRVYELMGIAPQRAVENLRPASTEAMTHGLTSVELSICRQMGLQPELFAAQRQATESGERPTSPEAMTRGLTSVELSVCRQMGLRPELFAAQKHATESGETTYGLTPEEQAACLKLNVSFSDYAASKRNGTDDPLYAALPVEAKNLCESMKMDRRQFVLWYLRSRETTGADSSRA